MTFQSSNPTPPRNVGNGGLVAIIVITFIAAIAAQELRWRGLVPGMSAPTQSGQASQLKRAESDVRSGDVADAKAIFKTLAAKGDARADYWLGVLAESDEEGPRDAKAIVDFYGKAAKAGVAAAKERLGEIYLHGDLVPPDYAKAFALLSELARAGEPRAAMFLSQMYRTGAGVPADPTLGYAWSEVAVLEGLNFAKMDRDQAMANLTPAQKTQGADEAASLLKEIAAQKKPAGANSKSDAAGAPSPN